MEHNPSLEIHNRSTGEEISSVLLNPPLYPILSQINPVRNLTPYLRSILILSSRVNRSGLFPVGFLTKIF